MRSLITAAKKRQIASALLDTANGRVWVNIDHVVANNSSVSTYFFKMDESGHGGHFSLFNGGVITIAVDVVDLTSHTYQIVGFKVGICFTNGGKLANNALQAFAASIKLLDVVWRDKWD